VQVISENFGIPRFPQTRSLDRAAWLAVCRNRYRDRILQEFCDFDYVVVVDTDLLGGWSYDGIANTFGWPDWDFVGSNGLHFEPGRRASDWPYFHVDVWAFRPAPGTYPVSLKNLHALQLRRGVPLLPVESSFGGLGIYRMECLRLAEYGGTDCEHVVLHDRLREAGLDRMFLNPSQIVMYSPI